MKKFFAAAALVALTFPALAGECLTVGYRCENACPLAKQANVCRSFGYEALASSRIARADISNAVVGNLARI